MTDSDIDETGRTEVIPGNKSWRQKIIAGICFGMIATACIWAAQVTTIIGLPFFYTVPLIFGLLGFIYGFDSLLVGFLTVFVGGLFYLDLPSLITATCGIFIPIALFIGLQDRRLWPDKTEERKESSNSLQWFLWPDVAHGRLRNGITLMSFIGVYGTAFVVSELVLGEYSIGFMNEFLFGEIDSAPATEGQRQIMSMLMHAAQYAPTYVTVVFSIWILASLKFAMASIRFIQMTVQPTVRLGQAALPVWYVIITALFGIIASQTIGDIRFITLNIAMILAIPAVIAGFGVIGDITRQIKYGWFLRWMIYLVVTLTATFGSLAIIAILGFLDAPLQMREWFIAKLGPKLEKKYA